MRRPARGGAATKLPSVASGLLSYRSVVPVPRSDVPGAGPSGGQSPRTAGFRRRAVPIARDPSGSFSSATSTRRRSWRSGPDRRTRPLSGHWGRSSAIGSEIEGRTDFHGSNVRRRHGVSHIRQVSLASTSPDSCTLAEPTALAPTAQSCPPLRHGAAARLTRSAYKFVGHAKGAANADPALAERRRRLRTGSREVTRVASRMLLSMVFLGDVARPWGDTLGRRRPGRRRFGRAGRGTLIREMR